MTGYFFFSFYNLPESIFMQSCFGLLYKYSFDFIHTSNKIKRKKLRTEMSVSAECVGTGGQYNIYANSQLIGEYTVGKVAYTMEKGCILYHINSKSLHFEPLACQFVILNGKNTNFPLFSIYL